MAMLRHLCPGMVLWKSWLAQTGPRSTQGFLLGQSLCAEVSLLHHHAMSRVERIALVPRWLGRTCPSLWPSLPQGMWHGPETAQQHLLSIPSTLFLMTSIHLGAATVLAFGAPPPRPGQGTPGEEDAIPRKRIAFHAPIHAWCLISSHPPQVIANLSRLSQVSPAALLLCLSHSREQCWGSGGITPGSPTLARPYPGKGTWWFGKGNLSSRPHPHPHCDLHSSLATKSLLVWTTRSRRQGWLPTAGCQARGGPRRSFEPFSSHFSLFPRHCCL